MRAFCNIALILLGIVFLGCGADAFEVSDSAPVISM